MERHIKMKNLCIICGREQVCCDDYLEEIKMNNMKIVILRFRFPYGQGTYDEEDEFQKTDIMSLITQKLYRGKMFRNGCIYAIALVNTQGKSP